LRTCAPAHPTHPKHLPNPATKNTAQFVSIRLPNVCPCDTKYQLLTRYHCAATATSPSRATIQPRRAPTARPINASATIGDHRNSPTFDENSVKSSQGLERCVKPSAA
jgi:hypothetical protein